MRIFLTGASGLLGINYALTASIEHQILAIYNKRPIKTNLFQTKRLDLFDESNVRETLEQWEPNWIVHCAALADINQCEANPILADLSNSQLSKQLAKLAAQYNIKFLYISTDCIFDGKKEVYSESDRPMPINVYGKTKLLGEQAVLNTCSDALIARVNFYGWSLTGARSLAEWVLQNLRNKNKITGFTDVYFCPLLANSLAKILIQMMSANLTGIYHVVSSDKLNKYDFAINLARQFNLDEKLISPGSIKETNSKVERPMNMVLNNNKLRAALKYSIPQLAQDIHQFHQLELKGYANQLLGINGEKSGN